MTSHWRLSLYVKSRLARPVTAERVMHWLAVAACVFFAGVAMWESFGYPRSGHLSTGAAYAMAGENIVNWRKFSMFTGYSLRPVNPDQYYCHHPYGIAVLQAIAYVLFGHHWFTVRAGAILCSALSPPFLYAFGRRAWGVIPAATATIFFCFVPIALAFANFSNLEEPTICFGLLFAWGTAGVWQTGKARYQVLSALGALGAANGDWAGLVFLGPVVAFGFFRAYVAPRAWYGRIDDRAFAKWFAYATAAAVGTLVFYLAFFGKADKLGDLMGSYHLRSSGSEATLTDQLSQRRKLWLGSMLSPISYGAMALGLPLAVLRLVKKPLEIVPIAWFISASFQYFVFKQGADIHIFWPHYYAPTAALAAGTLTATLMDGREHLLGLMQRVKAGARSLRFVRAGSAGLLGAAMFVPIALLARMGIPELVQARKTAGRFDQGGHFIGTDADLTQFAEWSVSNVATTGSVLQALEKFDFNFSAEYAINRPYVRVSSLTTAKPEDPQRIAVVDTRNQQVRDLENIAKQFGVQIVGPFWRVDRAIKGPQLTARVYEEREPRPLEWLLYSGTDLIRTISRDDDPWQTWEWRDALGLPAPVPEGVPVTPDQLRVAHNIAVSQKETARADELAARLASVVKTPLGIKYTGGLTLQGLTIQQGPAIVVTLFWEADDRFKRTDAVYLVKCKVVAPPRLWSIPLDYFEKDMSPVIPLRPASWKPGYLYTQRFVALHRIGREECRGNFAVDLHPESGEPNPVLFTLD